MNGLKSQAAIAFCSLSGSYLLTNLFPVLCSGNKEEYISVATQSVATRCKLAGYLM